MPVERPEAPDDPELTAAPEKPDSAVNKENADVPDQPDLPVNGVRVVRVEPQAPPVLLEKLAGLESLAHAENPEPEVAMVSPERLDREEVLDCPESVDQQDRPDHLDGMAHLVSKENVVPPVELELLEVTVALENKDREVNSQLDFFS